MKNSTKIPTVIVGIPAHNEERLIGSVLNALTKQKTHGFSLKRIVVYSDASTDRTNNQVLRHKNPRVELISSENRKGKTEGIKQLLKYSKKQGAEVLIILDADLTIKKTNVLELLIEKMESSPRIVAVSGHALPLKPGNFLQRIGAFGFSYMESLMVKTKNKELFYRSSDPLIALKVSAFTDSKLQHVHYMHDEFYYLFAKKNNKLFAFEKNATVYFKLPNNVGDYVNQMLRYISNHPLKDYSYEDKNFNFTIQEKASSILRNLKNDPFGGFGYIAIQGYIHVVNKLHSRVFQNSWTYIASTK